MPTKCPICSGKLSQMIGHPSERRKVCYSCGAQVSVESWAEDAPKDYSGAIEPNMEKILTPM
jgi:hypothetical protein